MMENDKRAAAGGIAQWQSACLAGTGPGFGLQHHVNKGKLK